VEPETNLNRQKKCANCGSEGAVFNNLCQSCFLHNQPLVLRRAWFKIPKCLECGNVYYLGTWSHPGIDEVEQLINGVEYQVNRTYKFGKGKNLKVKVMDAEISGIETGQDKVTGQVRISWKVDPFTPLIKTEESYEGKLKWRRCSECQTREEVKFAAKLQIRFTNRFEKEEEITKFQKIFSSYQAEQDLFKLREARGGFDIILNSKVSAKSIAQHYVFEHGADLKISAEITAFDRHTTKAVTRDIIAIRYADLIPGDLVDFSGKIRQITSYTLNKLQYFDYETRSFKKTDKKILNTASLAVSKENFDDFQVIDLNHRDNILTIMNLNSSDYQTFDVNLADFPGLQQGEEFRATMYNNKIYFNHLKKTSE